MFPNSVHVHFLEKHDIPVRNVSMTRSHMHDPINNFIIVALFFQIELVTRKCENSETFGSVSFQNFIKVNILASITSVSSNVDHHNHLSFVGGQVAQRAVDQRVIEIVQRHVRRWFAGRPATVFALYGIIILKRGSCRFRRFGGC